MANWQDRIIGEGYEAPSDLLANPFNYRIHTKFQQDSLKAVLDEVGWVQRIIVNQRTQHLIDGHLRVTLADRNGEAQIPVIYVDLSEDEEKLILATIDPLSALAVHDAAQYESLLRDVMTDNADLQALLADTAEKMGVLLTDFQPVGADEQPRLDELNPVICPHCGRDIREPVS